MVKLGNITGTQKDRRHPLIQIEFFMTRFVVFVFPMSARMRKIAKKYNNVEINHRSFALGWEAEDLSVALAQESVKPEVLGHWEHANENDDEHRFNIEECARQTLISRFHSLD